MNDHKHENYQVLPVDGWLAKPGGVKAFSNLHKLNGNKAYSNQAMSNSAHPAGFEGLAGHGHDSKLVFRPEAHVDLLKAQQWGKNDACGIHSSSIEESITSLEQLGGLPSVDSIICIMQNCRKSKVFAYAKRVHMYVHASGLEVNSMLGNYLVPMFVECGSIPDAEHIFHRLVFPNEYSWTSLIQGYVEYGECQHAFDLFQKMQEEGVYPARHTYVALLKACAGLKNVELGQRIHTDIAKEGLERDPFVGNTLVDMYGKCGLLIEAREVFDNLLVQDVVSWTVLIGVYSEHGLDEEALNCLEQMQVEGVSENVVTFVCGLKACGNLKALDKGREIHAEIIKRKLEGNSFSGNTLVDMYAKCGTFAEAQKSFEQLPVRDVVSWTVLIAGCAEHGLSYEALECLAQMQLEGVPPNTVTFKCSLKACGKVGALDRGRKVHLDIAKEGFERDLSVGNTLVDMYAKCGSLKEAQAVFDKLLVRDDVSWNALIAGYADHGLGEQALNCMEQMQLEGFSPVAITLLCCLKACSSLGDIHQGHEIHDVIAKKGYQKDPFVGSSLVDMYAKCYSTAEARFLFDELLSQDVVLWSAMISAYADEGESDKAFLLYTQMLEQGLCPNSVTFVSILKACGNATFLETGRQVHAQTCIVDAVELTDVSLETAVIHMYSKCGSMYEALQVFDAAPTTDPVRWTALITGYAHHGQSEHVFYLLERMVQEDVQPDGILLLSVLAVCNHAGLADEGVKYFEAMNKKYGIAPSIMHFNCMVDLLSRIGRLDEAMAMLEEMPFSPSFATWSTLLNACGKWGKVDLGRLAFERTMSMDEKYSAAYILMSNMYSDGHVLKDVEERKQ